MSTMSELDIKFQNYFEMVKEHLNKKEHWSEMQYEEYRSIYRVFKLLKAHIDNDPDEELDFEPSIYLAWDDE